MQNLNDVHGVDVPLVLMNSFNTHEDTEDILRKCVARERVDGKGAMGVWPGKRARDMYARGVCNWGGGGGVDRESTSTLYTPHPPHIRTDSTTPICLGRDADMWRRSWRSVRSTRAATRSS